MEKCVFLSLKLWILLKFCCKDEFISIVTRPLISLRYTIATELANGLVVMTEQDHNKKKLAIEFSKCQWEKAFIWVSGLHFIEKNIING